MSELPAAPQLRRIERASYRCWDMLVPLVPLTVYSCVYYGWRPLWVMLFSIGSAVLCEVLGYAVRMQKAPLSDGTAVVTGGIIGLTMSPIAPYWLPVIASALAIWLVKLPFGGRGRNLFNPAAAGIAFLTVCFPKQLFTYPDPEQYLADNLLTASSPALLLRNGAVPDYDAMDVVLSNIPGPIGSVLIILAACILYLLVRRASSGLVVLPFLSTCALWAILFPRVEAGAGTSVLLELCAGYLMLTATYFIADPVTAPRHPLARVCYGVLAGVLVMLLRRYGAYEEGACFAVLLVNTLSDALDRGCWWVCYRLRKLWDARKGGVTA